MKSYSVGKTLEKESPLSIEETERAKACLDKLMKLSVISEDEENKNLALDSYNRFLKSGDRTLFSLYKKFKQAEKISPDLILNKSSKYKKETIDISEYQVTPEELKKMREQLSRFYKRDTKERRRLNGSYLRSKKDAYPPNDLVLAYEKNLQGVEIDKEGVFKYEDEKREADKKKILVYLKPRISGIEYWKNCWKDIEEMAGAEVPYEHVVRFPELHEMIFEELAFLLRNYWFGGFGKKKGSQFEELVNHVVKVGVLEKSEMLRSDPVKRAIEEIAKERYANALVITRGSKGSPKEDIKAFAEIIESCIETPMRKGIIATSDVLRWKWLKEDVKEAWREYHKTPKIMRTKVLSMDRVKENAKQEEYKRLQVELLKIATPSYKSIILALEKNEWLKITNWYDVHIPKLRQKDFVQFSAEYKKSMSLLDRTKTFLRGKRALNGELSKTYMFFQVKELESWVKKSILTEEKVNKAYEKALAGRDEELKEFGDIYLTKTRHRALIEDESGRDEFGVAKDVESITEPLEEILSPEKALTIKEELLRYYGVLKKEDELDEVEKAYQRFIKKGESIPLLVLYKRWKEERKDGEVIKTEGDQWLMRSGLSHTPESIQVKNKLPEKVTAEEVKNMLLRHYIERGKPDPNKVLDAYDNYKKTQDEHELAILYAKHIDKKT